MRSFLLTYLFWVSLVAVGLIALARWFHPATYSLQMLLYTTIFAFVVGTIYLGRSSR